MEKAICYIRVSTEEQAKEGVSLDAQEERLIAYCKMSGLDIAGIIREEGVSASKPLSSRPGGEVLHGMVTKREVAHVVALKLDRLFRNAEDALSQTKHWDKMGVALHLVDMGGQTLNTTGAMGRLMLTMMAAYAEFERNIIAERTESALKFKKTHNEAYCPTPYGFDRRGKKLTVNREERETIENILKWRKDGLSYRAIASELNRQGIPTKSFGQKNRTTTGRWYASTIQYIVANSLHKENIHG